MDMLEKIKSTTFFKSYKLNEDILDVTTKLIARKYIMNFVNYLVNRDIPFTLAILDIDNFKSINDTYGHLVGDEILSKTAKVICDTIGDIAFVGRYGGDEFLLIFPNITGYQDKWAALKKAHVAAREGIVMNDGTTISITATTGAASFPDDEQNVDTLFKKADAMLYRGKQKGRDRFIIFVYEKHKDMVFDIQKSLPENMNRIRSLFDGKRNLEYEIYESLSVLVQIIGVDGAAIYPEGNKTIIYRNGGEKHKFPVIEYKELETRFENHRILVNNRAELDNDKSLQSYLEKEDLRSCLVVELEAKRCYLGYLALFSSHNRVWQDSEIALSQYLAAIISDNLYFLKKDSN